MRRFNVGKFRKHVKRDRNNYGIYRELWHSDDIALFVCFGCESTYISQVYVGLGYFRSVYYIDWQSVTRDEFYSKIIKPILLRKQFEKLIG